MEKMIQQALIDLETAAKAMLEPTGPATPLPRVRIFTIAEKIHWPYCNPDQKVKWKQANVYGKATFLSILSMSAIPPHAAREIVATCGHQPRQVLRALRRIQAATAWCYARAEGRKRAAEEILRQQQGAVDALKAEAALQALGKEV